VIGLSVTGADRAARNLARAKARVLTAQEAGVRRSTLMIERALKLEMTQAAEMDAFWGKKGSAGDGLSARTGRTRASVTGGGTSLRVGDRVVGAVGSKEKHLKLHESGGTVRGTSPQGYARVPTAAAQTGAGVDRWAGMSIRDIPGAFLMRSATGRLWAAMGAGNRLRFLYLLVKSVTLKPRHIFERVKRQNEPRVVELMRSEVAVVVREANS
jgi:hypothetical protein